MHTPTMTKKYIFNSLTVSIFAVNLHEQQKQKEPNEEDEVGALFGCIIFFRLVYDFTFIFIFIFIYSINCCKICKCIRKNFSFYFIFLKETKIVIDIFYFMCSQI